jgi:FMN phosphatase YigB (HAD superfamily)
MQAPRAPPASASANRRTAALLLDVDGVILHAPRALGRVAQRARDYVQRELGLTDHRYATRVNKLLYSEHGHTLLGLRKVFGAPLSTRHFADAVYDAETLALLRAEENRMDFQWRVQEARGVMLRAAELGAPIFLFTNAPKSWAKIVYDAGKLSQYLPESHILASDHPLFANSLKPDPEVYKNLADHLRDQGVVSPVPKASHGRLVFVDDSYGNLAPTLSDPNWRNVHYSPGGPMIQTKRLVTVKRLAEVRNVL